MEETEQNNDEASKEEGDVPIEQVEKVITDSKQEEKNENQNPEEYKDLSEDEAKEELDKMVVPENTGQTVEPSQTEESGEDLSVVQPSEAVEGQSGTDQLTTQSPSSVTKVGTKIRYLQFQCANCEFKQYINLEDDLKEELGEKVRCMNCGKKKSLKKRIFNNTIDSYEDYETAIKKYRQ